jgi:hypothetical protein
MSKALRLGVVLTMTVVLAAAAMVASGATTFEV